MNMENIGKRWSGADWADQKQEIMLIGCGGIGSFTALSLSRIDHDLYLIDPDRIDQTNVTGGQLFKQSDVGKFKVEAVANICREFGCTNFIDPNPDYYSPEMGMLGICITGLDNMKARKLVFEEWLKNTNDKVDKSKCLFIDGRLTIEMFEVFCVQANNDEQIQKYYEEHLFDDDQANVLDCTTKQSTFGAMAIASYITATLCNWLTNNKHGFELREVPFYQRIHFPMMQQKLEVIEEHIDQLSIAV